MSDFDDDNFVSQVDQFREELCEKRGVEEIPESDTELCRMIEEQNDQAMVAMGKAMLAKKRAESLINKPDDRQEKRIKNTENALRWLTFHRHSTHLILANVMGMKSPEGGRAHCMKMLKEGLIKRINHDIYGRFPFMLYGITKLGLDTYYTQFDQEPAFRSNRVFKPTDGIGTTMKHDHILQWVQLHLESIDYVGKEAQYWLSDFMLPGYTPPGEKKHPDAWPTFPDGILKNAPFSWRGLYDSPPGYAKPLDKKCMYKNLSADSQLYRDGMQGDYGYLNVAVEVEKTIKDPKRYIKLIDAHEENIAKGRYDAVLYLRSTKTKTHNLDARFNKHLRNKYISIEQENRESRRESEPLWEKHKRKFIFDTYEQYIKKSKKNKRSK